MRIQNLKEHDRQQLKRIVQHSREAGFEVDELACLFDSLSDSVKRTLSRELDIDDISKKALEIETLLFKLGQLASRLSDEPIRPGLSVRKVNSESVVLVFVAHDPLKGQCVVLNWERLLELEHVMHELPIASVDIFSPAASTQDRTVVLGHLDINDIVQIRQYRPEQ